AAFQHEKLISAGEKYLNERDENSLKVFLQNVKPDLKLSPEEMNEAQAFLKPAVLTEKNFNVKKAMVLEKLKNLMDAQRSSLN
ncbi:MAG TPA: hypothetical protein DD624_08385, partial [Alphaproteobacteria bacterium]|nr:hypothetical protein [Alphaproteobacteria bacterium]